MKLKKMALVAEIAVLLIVLVVVDWLATVFLHTRAFWPLMVYTAIYLCIRVALAARKTRAG